MVSKKNKDEMTRKNTTITADYILALYKESKKITNKKEQKEFIRDVKKLIPYIGEEVVIEL